MESDNGKLWLLFEVTAYPCVDSLYLFTTRQQIVNTRKHRIAASYFRHILKYVHLNSLCDTVVGWFTHKLLLLFTQAALLKKVGGGGGG